MAIALTVGGITYQYPTLNDEQWSSNADDWAEAVTFQLQQIAVTGDIGPVNLVSIVNNQASPANVTNLILSPSTIRAGFVEYYVQRTTASSEISEAGMMYILYNDLAASYTIANVGNNVGTTGVEFSVSNTGQVKYTSSNLIGQTQGRLKYRLRILQKT